MWESACATSRSVDFARDGDAGLAQNVRDLGFPEARRVIFEGELILRFVHAEAAQAVGIREFAEAAELFEAQRSLQFVGDFEECHASKYKAKEPGGKGRAALAGS